MRTESPFLIVDHDLRALEDLRHDVLREVDAAAALFRCVDGKWLDF